VIVNVALEFPAGTVTGPGVTTSPSMLPFTQTEAPPEGAGPVSVNVAVVVPPPPTMLLLANVKDARLGAGGGLPAGISVSQVSGAR